MTFASIAIAMPLAAALASVLGWAFIKGGLSAMMAAWWACSLATLVSVAALLSDSPAGMVRAVWPREAVDWLGIAAVLLTGVAACQTRPVPIGRSTLLIGLLLGMLIACRLLYGSVYLRPSSTSLSSWLAIASSGAALGLCWHVELARTTERRLLESLVCGVIGLGAAATLGMSGSFQYATIGALVTLSGAAAWLVTHCWPAVCNLICLMLVGLGMAFAELDLPSMLGLGLATLIVSCIGRRPALRAESPHTVRRKLASTLAVIGLITLCVGWNAQRFMQEVKGNNASHGGYEAYR